ncbi:hypothetical protein CAI16_20030 [Virgibacillus dokdonensis]|uniref:Uncharacterized protein n=1 Tax=Virgibacillus dokdonensis TaxID=302167 RepID=A0A3E0WFN3_9BACI|nr:hypothetical protein [Virgibacillus dokdonensis]RFA31752.1 hypothetical protein CAI16_20030 [Virgibacillus dokdonensis]
MFKKVFFVLSLILVFTVSQIGDFNRVNAEDNYNGNERGEFKLQSTQLDAISPFNFTPGGGGTAWRHIGTFKYQKGLAGLTVNSIATVIASRVPYVNWTTAASLAQNIYNYLSSDDDFYITLKEWHQYSGGRIIGVKREAWVYYNKARTDLVRPDLVNYPIRELERY